MSDGDTITVLHNGVGERIPLHGTDTREKRQAYGKRAIQFTSTLIFGKTVPAQVVDHAHYGRTVGEVILEDGYSLNRELFRAGFAWWYQRSSDDQSIGDLEAEAKEARCRLRANPDPIPPWEWRIIGAPSR